MTKKGITLTHLTGEGHAHMVDVGEKDVTTRRATARARVRMTEATFRALSLGETPKGDVLAAARIAGIQASKLTPQLIPLCHAVHLTRVEVAIRLEDGAAIVDATAEARDRTGVEMEAMVAASAAALTLYDMLKAADRGMSFDVELLEKRGGRSGHWTRPSHDASAAGAGGEGATGEGAGGEGAGGAGR
ncbi:MAG: cyclic pyranopterin monophosphate synthase MoaC [Labilithrix sp.]|nr:cyclic pyranopterin monophosphate synthase MoaC [Labilithrix sp.]